MVSGQSRGVSMFSAYKIYLSFIHVLEAFVYHYIVTPSNLYLLVGSSHYSPLCFILSTLHLCFLYLSLPCLFLHLNLSHPGVTPRYNEETQPLDDCKHRVCFVRPSWTVFDFRCCVSNQSLIQFNHLKCMYLPDR
jgi:hypothetical protein